MSHTREVLYALMRQAFTESWRARVGELCRRRPVDWNSLAAVAAAEGVAPVVGVNLAACEATTTTVPAAVTERFQKALFENVAVKIARRQQLVTGVAHFDACGYDVLLVKSAALEASRVYERAWVTCARDVDLVLRRRGTAPAAPAEWAVRAVSRDKGIECEINGHHDVSIYGLVTLSFEDIWRNAVPVPFEEAPASPAYVMCPEDFLLTLCLNACRQQYFRLKALFDIAETVRHYPDLDWGGLEARVQTSESRGIVFTALCVADETIGLSGPAREFYPRLVGHRQAQRLRWLVSALRRSSAPGRVGLLALRYASFNKTQRLRSAQRSALQWPGRRMTAGELAESTLPGQ